MTTMPPPPEMPPAPGPISAKDAKAHAKAAKAYAKAQRPFWKKKRFLLPVALIALIGIGIGLSGGGDDKPSSGVSTGFGTKDASADVKVVRLEPADAIGGRLPVLEITNNSSKRSNYYIELSLETADGKTQLDSTAATAQNVEPGQATGGSVVPFLKAEDAPADAVVKVKSVSRTAA